jgi:hypothetical protein
MDADEFLSQAGNEVICIDLNAYGGSGKFEASAIST